MYSFVFSKKAADQWNELEDVTRKFIQQKLVLLKDEALFRKSVKSVKALAPATHRIRCGNYRLLLECDFSSGKHLILRLGHRRDIYK